MFKKLLLIGLIGCLSLTSLADSKMGCCESDKCTCENSDSKSECNCSTEMMNKMVGRELKEYGKVFGNDNLTIVHKHLKANEKIPKHNHPDEMIFFTVVSGKVEVLLNEKESHIMESSKILNFDGKNHISASALEESDIFVFLLKK